MGISPFNRTPILLHDHDEYLERGVYLAGIGLYKAILASLTAGW